MLRTWLMIAVIAVLLAVIAVMILLVSRKKTRTAPAAPIPGGGGRYTMYVEGMNCEHCKASAEAALNAIPGIQAEADLRDGTISVRYSDYPALSLLDELRRAVEDAGFSVKEIR